MKSLLVAAILLLASASVYAQSFGVPDQRRGSASRSNSAYLPLTNPASPLYLSCQPNKERTVYTITTNSSLTVNFVGAPCAPGQYIEIDYNQTGTVAITYSGTAIKWLSNCDGTGTCNQPGLSGSGDIDAFLFRYEPAIGKILEVGQGLNVTPNYVINPMTTLGDVMYGGNAGLVTRLAGNTSAIPQTLNSTGSGSVATAPAFSSLPVFDVETNGSAGTAINKLAKQIGGAWITASTGDATVPLDVVAYGAGTSGSVGLIVAGAANLIFDGQIIQDHAFGASTTAAGQGHDLGPLATACSVASNKVLGTITALSTGSPGSTPQAVKVNLGACNQSVGGGGSSTVDWLNVTQHGVTCDGATDTTAAFQAVLNSATVTNGGKVVYIPANAYGSGCRVTSLTLPAGVSLVGDGPHSSFITCNGSGVSCITQTGALDGSYPLSASFIRNLGISNIGTSTHAIDIEGITSFGVDHVWVGWGGAGFTAAGIYLKADLRGYVRDSFINNSAGSGGAMEVDGVANNASVTSTTIMLTGNHISSNTSSYGLMIDRSSNIVVEGGSIESTGTPIGVVTKSEGSSPSGLISIRDLDIENPGGTMYIKAGSGWTGSAGLGIANGLTVGPNVHMTRSGSSTVTHCLEVSNATEVDYYPQYCDVNNSGNPAQVYLSEGTVNHFNEIGQGAAGAIPLIYNTTASALDATAQIFSAGVYAIVPNWNSSWALENQAPASLTGLGTCDVYHEGIKRTQTDSTHGSCTVNTAAAGTGTKHCEVVCQYTGSAYQWAETGVN